VDSASDAEAILAYFLKFGLEPVSIRTEGEPVAATDDSVADQRLADTRDSGARDAYFASDIEIIDQNNRSVDTLGGLFKPEIRNHVQRHP
jgi:hypothetical protein